MTLLVEAALKACVQSFVPRDSGADEPLTFVEHPSLALTLNHIEGDAYAAARLVTVCHFVETERGSKKAAAALLEVIAHVLGPSLRVTHESGASLPAAARKLLDIAPSLTPLYAGPVPEGAVRAGPTARFVIDRKSK